MLSWTRYIPEAKKKIRDMHKDLWTSYSTYNNICYAYAEKNMYTEERQGVSNV